MTTKGRVIKRWMKYSPTFVGVFSTHLSLRKLRRVLIEGVLKRNKEFCCVLHVDKCHWVGLVFFPALGLVYFDPLGVTQIPRVILKLLKRLRQPIFYNRVGVQPLQTTLCGEYVCLFLITARNLSDCDQFVLLLRQFLR